MKTRSHHPANSFFQGWTKGMGAIALTITALVLPACESPAPDETVGTAEPPVTESPVIPAEEGVTEEDTAAQPPTDEPITIAENAENVELGDLTGNVQDYIGQTVSVRSAVAEEVGANGFLLQNEGLFGGEPVLVINATQQPLTLPADDIEVQATGEVRQFVLTDIEQEYGLELEPDLYVEYEQQPTIVAQSIAPAPDPAEVTEDPTRFFNQVIAVEGSIGEFVAPGVFRLDEDQLFGGEGLLVLSNVTELAEAALQTGEVDEGDVIVVTGTLRPYVQAEFEQDYGWGDEVLGELEEYDREPVLVAREIYSSAE